MTAFSLEFQTKTWDKEWTKRGAIPNCHKSQVWNNINHTRRRKGYGLKITPLQDFQTQL